MAPIALILDHPSFSASFLLLVLLSVCGKLEAFSSVSKSSKLSDYKKFNCGVINWQGYICCHKLFYVLLVALFQRNINHKLDLVWRKKSAEFFRV